MLQALPDNRLAILEIPAVDLQHHRIPGPEFLGGENQNQWGRRSRRANEVRDQCSFLWKLKKTTHSIVR